MTDNGWPKIVEDAMTNALALNVQRRALVLRYPDIAKKLTAPPYRLARPDQWTGFIPDRWLPDDAAGRTRPNNSPIRAQLLAVLQEAAERADNSAHQPERSTLT